MASGEIRVGIGGWTFEPWRGHFYEKGVKTKDELAFASGRLKVIEINGTYYSSQKPATFAKWASETPDNFVFSMKASRFCTNRRVLAEAGESVMKFVSSGIAELGGKLGPILWQFMPTKQFDADDFEAFLTLLPKSEGGIALKHVVEVRHPSFLVPKFVQMLKKHGVAVVVADHHDYPMIADVTADFVYLRLQKGEDTNPACYAEKDISLWSERLKQYASGGIPGDMPVMDAKHPLPAEARDVYAFFITGGKVNAPFGAMALQKIVG